MASTDKDIEFVVYVVAIIAADILFRYTWPKHNLLMWNAFRTTLAALLFLVAAVLEYATDTSPEGIPWPLWAGLALALVAAGPWVWGLREAKHPPPRTPWD